MTGIRTVRELLAETGVKTRRPPAAAAPARRTGIRSARPYGERSPVDRLLLESAGAGLKALYDLYFDLEVRGSDHLPAEPPYLIAANHASHLDTPAVVAALREARGAEAARALHVLGARDYFFDTALKGWFFSTFLNVVPIEREEASLAGLRMVKSILSQGESALIFPEGTRSRTGVIQPFKPGLGLLAWELKVPIVPAHIGGTHDALPAGRTVPRRQRVTVAFGPPVTMEAYASAGRTLARDALYRTIVTDVRRIILGMANGAAPPGR